MPKAAHAAKLAFIRRLCLASDSIHAATAQLIAELSQEQRYATSVASLKPKSRRPSKP
jgi:hypothetical protein